MENMGEWEQKNLINELTQGRELARQLQVHLNVPSSSSHETREFLVQKIQASYEKALSMLNFNTSNLLPAADQPQPSGSGVAIRMLSESPPSRSGSPRSEDSDRDLKEHELKDASRKRTTLPRWTQLVRVTPGTALEGSLDDGFSWRKYGQKDILGAKYPRGYYRCTHRNVQGCLATKQVQRSDDDPTTFEITYRGRHTCNLASHAPPASGPSENQEQGPCIEPNPNQQPEQNQNQSQNLLLNFQRGLKVITQDLDVREQTYPSFPYPTSSSTTSSIKVENNNVFSPSLMDKNVVGNLSSASFMSHAASGATSNYFSMSSSPSRMNINFRTTSDPQLCEVIQATAASATNSPTVGLDDFPFANAQFDPNFTFDNHGFFS